MMTVEEIREALQTRSPTEVAKATGLSRMGIYDIKDNPNANPKWSTVKTLSEYLSK